MRDLKFRVWDKHEGGQRMIPWEQLVRLDYEQELSIRDILTGADLVGRNYFPMQYTGLKDRLGKEIYDRDILDDSMERVGMVGWIEDGWAVEWHTGAMIYVRRLAQDVRVSTVIGNIKENPDLLEAKDAH